MKRKPKVSPATYSDVIRFRDTDFELDRLIDTLEDARCVCSFQNEPDFMVEGKSLGEVLAGMSDQLYAFLEMIARKRRAVECEYFGVKL